jgi:DNA-binding response OmpR family regulator
MPIRLLLVEDDETSRHFLSEALRALPARVDEAADIGRAIALASVASHDLWIVDAHLPDGDGASCLRELRQQHQTPALAITAGASREELDRLCSCGYLEVLLKPVSIALLHATVLRLLGRGPESGPPAVHGKLPAWDEARALAAIGGNHESLMALRRIFLDELPTLRAQAMAAQAANDNATLAAVLHKLKASCGFVGAARLLAAVEALDRSPSDAWLAAAFGHAADDALDA